MSAASVPGDENARKIVKTVFQALARVGQDEVAKALSVSDSTVSRMKDDVPRFAGLLERLGLKVVPIEMQCYDEKTIASILVLANQRMAQLQTPQQLAQDWDKPTS